jgi:hypothetical protein
MIALRQVAAVSTCCWRRAIFATVRLFGGNGSAAEATRQFKGLSGGAPQRTEAAAVIAAGFAVEAQPDLSFAKKLSLKLNL